jgi:hypothetical protein
VDDQVICIGRVTVNRKEALSATHSLAGLMEHAAQEDRAGLKDNSGIGYLPPAASYPCHWSSEAARLLGRDHSALFLATDEGRPVGFACVEMDDLHTGHILRLYARRDAPSETASRLLAIVLTWLQLQNAAAVRCTVPLGDRTQPLLQAVGFAPTHTIETAMVDAAKDNLRRHTNKWASSAASEKQSVAP